MTRREEEEGEGRGRRRRKATPCPGASPRQKPKAARMPRRQPCLFLAEYNATDAGPRATVVQRCAARRRLPGRSLSLLLLVLCSSASSSAPPPAEVACVAYWAASTTDAPDERQRVPLPSRRSTLWLSYPSGSHTPLPHCQLSLSMRTLLCSDQRFFTAPRYIMITS